MQMSEVAFWEMLKPSKDVSCDARSSQAKNGDKRGTGIGISSKQDGDTRVAWRVRDRRKNNLIDTGVYDN
jgi:hypothetical protein